MKLLGIDTESGGIFRSGETMPSLLTLYMCVVDESFNVKEEFDILLKPDAVAGRCNYTIQAEALKINGIDLMEHDLVAIPYKEAKQKIYKWLEGVNKTHGRLTPFGNRVQGDVDIVTYFTISPESWENLVDRRVIELSSVGKTLQMMGLIPEDQSLSLSKIAEYLKVEVDSKLVHTACYDVWMGKEVLKNYMKIMGWK